MPLFKTIPKLRVIFRDFFYFRTTTVFLNGKINNYSGHYSKYKSFGSSGYYKPLFVPASLLAFSLFSSSSDDKDDSGIFYLIENIKLYRLIIYSNIKFFDTILFRSMYPFRQAARSFSSYSTTQFAWSRSTPSWSSNTRKQTPPTWMGSSSRCRRIPKYGCCTFSLTRRCQNRHTWPLYYSTRYRSTKTVGWTTRFLEFFWNFESI